MKFHTLKKVAVTLKTGSRSPKSNQLVPPSQQCICASLVKICPSVQKITCGKEATRTQTGSAPKRICPPPIRQKMLISPKKSFEKQEESSLSAVLPCGITLRLNTFGQGFPIPSKKGDFAREIFICPLNFL